MAKTTQKPARHYEPLPDCGHDERYELHWREENRAGGRANVWFCIACNYEIVTKQIAEGIEPEE